MWRQVIGIFQVRGILAPFKRWRVIWLSDMIRLDYVMLYLLPYYITLFYSVLYYITILHYILNIYIYIDVSCKFPQIKPWYEHAPAHPSPLKMLQRASGRTEGCHGILVWMAQPSPEKQKKPGTCWYNWDCHKKINKRDLWKMGLTSSVYVYMYI